LAEILEMTPGAVSLVMNKHMAVNLRIAPLLASAFGCEVAEFSPRLAAMLQVRPKPEPSEDPYGESGLSGEQSPRRPPTPAGAITVADALQHVAWTLQNVPDRHRVDIGRQLELLASIPDSQMLVKRIAMALTAYDRPSVPPRIAETIQAQRASAGLLLERRLAELPRKEREDLEAVFNGLIDRVIGKLDDQADHPTPAEHSPSPEPTPAPASHP
jgi:hypothetical protein